MKMTMFCNYLDDDGQSIEQYPTPILQDAVINGSDGIGTGYSTSIPMCNPKTICRYIKAKIADEENSN